MNTCHQISYLFQTSKTSHVSEPMNYYYGGCMQSRGLSSIFKWEIKKTESTFTLMDILEQIFAFTQTEQKAYWTILSASKTSDANLLTWENPSLEPNNYSEVSFSTNETRVTSQATKWCDVHKRSLWRPLLRYGNVIRALSKGNYNIVTAQNHGHANKPRLPPQLIQNKKKTLQIESIESHHMASAVLLYNNTQNQMQVYKFSEWVKS